MPKIACGPLLCLTLTGLGVACGPRDVGSPHDTTVPSPTGETGLPTPTGSTGDTGETVVEPPEGCWLRAPALGVLADDEVLEIVGPGTIETARIAVDGDPADADWVAQTTISGFDTVGPVRILARSDDPECGPDDRIDQIYDVQPAYPGAAGTPTSRAVAADDPRFVAWADRSVDVTYGEDVDETWRTPELATGPAATASPGLVVLGRGGSITMGFAAPFADGPGDDFAVFENSFSDTFLELGRVAVSTDGITFAAFDTAARTPDPVGAFGATDPTTVHGFAGVYRGGFGTPFDLAVLRSDPAVRDGRVDLAAIAWVRIDDVVGDGSERDAFGRPIHDPFPTVGSAGFDLDAVGVLAAE